MGASSPVRENLATFGRVAQGLEQILPDLATLRPVEVPGWIASKTAPIWKSAEAGLAQAERLPAPAEIRSAWVKLWRALNLTVWVAQTIGGRPDKPSDLSPSSYIQLARQDVFAWLRVNDVELLTTWANLKLSDVFDDVGTSLKRAFAESREVLIFVALGLVAIWLLRG